MVGIENAYDFCRHALVAQAGYAAGDDPNADLPGYRECIWTETRAQRDTAFLLFDEVYRFPDWAAKLKGKWDRIRRKRLTIHVVATGSSALGVATGSLESLAARFEMLTLSHWPAASLAAVFHRSPHDAVDGLVQFGSYPGAVEFEKNPPRWHSYLRDAIIELAIDGDVLAFGRSAPSGTIAEAGFWEHGGGDMP